MGNVTVKFLDKEYSIPSDVNIHYRMEILL